MNAEKRKEVLRILVNEERGFVLRIGWVVAASALLCFAYTLYSGEQYDVPAIVELDSSTAPQDLRPAFEGLKSLNFFSGVKRPDPLIPHGDPVLDSLEPMAILDLFVDGTAFISIETGTGRRLKSFLDQADSGKMTPGILEEAKKVDADFGRYLALRAGSFDPALIVGDTQGFCRGYAPCVAGVLQRRYPTAYNALVLLYRYAHTKEFTDRTIGYAKRNLGYFVSIREIAYDKGFPSLSSDRVVLAALRQVQISSVHNALISTVFLTIMALLFLGSAYRSSLWRDALVDGGAEENS